VTLDELRRGIGGAYRLMIGRSDGLELLDISADGFWNSFYAILLALPPLALSWASVAADFADGTTSRGGVLSRLAVVDIGCWVLPIVLLAFAARPAGIGDRFVHYVVATNWGSVLLVWLMVPAAAMRMVAPQAVELASFLSFVLFIVSQVLVWRLTTLAIGKGAAVGSAVYAAMFAVSLVTLFALQSLVGLSPSP
jgi:hypothetical protein